MRRECIYLAAPPTTRESNDDFDDDNGATTGTFFLSFFLVSVPKAPLIVCRSCIDEEDFNIPHGRIPVWPKNCFSVRESSIHPSPFHFQIKHSSIQPFFILRFRIWTPGSFVCGVEFIFCFLPSRQSEM